VRGGFRVADCNRHVIEPAEVWRDWLEPAFREEISVGGSPLSLRVRGRPVLQGFPDYLRDASFGIEHCLHDMDAEGVDAAILLPAAAMYAVAAEHVDPELAAALCRAYNNWLAEQIASHRDRLKGVALLPLQDPSAAAAELRRAANDLKFVAGLILPNPLLGRKPHDRVYDPLYAAAEAVGVPLVVSQAPGLPAPQIGHDRYRAPFALKGVAEPFELWLAAASFSGHNVLERFPGLKVGLIGAGCGWLPFWIDRLDEHWGNSFGTDAPNVLPPEDIFERQMFAACDPWENSLPDVMDELGEHTVVWGSHYPLPELAKFFPNEVDHIAGAEDLSSERRRAILWDNAARLFRL